MRTCIAIIALIVPLAGSALAQAPASQPRQDDPAIVKLLAGLKPGQSLRLPACKVLNVEPNSNWAKSGPGGRDYCNKMCYALDRQTAMFAGANHGAPSRLNDCWEYHLGSNTWIRLAAGDGGDHGAVNRAMGAIKQNKDVEKNTAFLTDWFTNNCVVRDGYLQTKGNGGPVCPWHTWDGLAYDASAGRLLWAVLDTDSVLMNYTEQYAKYTGQDFEKVKAQCKPGTGLYMFDPRAKRWARQIGGEPRPYLRGMGGSLVYIPEWKKTIWYCAAQNVSPNDFAMWTYDAATNTWADLKPNGGRGVRELVHVDKVAPSSEAQLAYSPKHRKIVAVLGKETFIYDLAENKWVERIADDGNYASDSATAFAYDEADDLFLLINMPEGQWGKLRNVRAFSLASKKWQTLAIDGPDIHKRPYARMVGYFDPRLNVMVVYDSSPDIWVFRPGPAAPASQPDVH